MKKKQTTVADMFNSFFSRISQVAKSLLPSVKEQGKRDMTLLLEAYREGGQEALQEFQEPSVNLLAGEPVVIESKPRGRKK